MSVDVRLASPGTRPEPPKRPVAPLSRASWHTAANAVVLVWLALTAVAAAGQGQPAAPRWLLIHLFLLGAVTNAIVTWSEHFAIALLRLPVPTPWWPAARTVLLNVGIVAVLWGSVSGHAMLASTGAGLIVWVVLWHVGAMIAGARRAFGGRFSHVVHWYVWSGLALVTGGTLGGLLVSGRLPGGWSQRLAAAHVHANLFGWVGLAVLGTLFTLWPTVLRTRMVEGAGTVAKRSLKLAVPGLVIMITGFSAGLRPLAAAGLLLYAAAAALALVPFLTTWRQRRPHTAASWMLAASVCWFIITIAADLAIVVSREPGEVAGPVGSLVPLILGGFVGQVLMGALTFLLPVVLGGGPAALKRNAALLERLWIPRLIAVNAAVPLIVLPPVPPPVRRIAWAVLLAALAGFVLLAATALVRSWWPRRPRLAAVVTSWPAGPAGIGAGAVLTVIAIAVALTAGPGLPGGVLFGGGPDVAPGQGTVAGGSQVRTVDITLAGMQIRPGTIDVPRGTRLVLRVTNQDTQPHDLRFATGEHTPMLGAGESATLRLPALKSSLDGWCTVPGHRAAGMTMKIRVTSAGAGGGTAASGHAGHTGHGSGSQSGSGAMTGMTGVSGMQSGSSATGALDLMAPMSAGFKPFDATLRPAPGGIEHKVEIRAVDTELEVAPGVKQQMWAFNGQVPGPVLRGKVGDVFTVTFINDGGMGHGIDFHAGSLAPDVPMRTIAPGERLTYRFKAERAGAWLYHCSTMPMIQHIANGMYGAVVIDPPGLPKADREYILVEGELYLGAPGSAEHVEKIRRGTPDGWMFNGTAEQYGKTPLTARVGERVRIWAVPAGPNTGTAFHIVGTQFDTVYKEGAYVLRPGADKGGGQVLDLAVAQGGFVETVFPEPGHYPFIDHAMLRGESGAHGVFEVTK